MKILMLSGPNLNRLGKRAPEHYGLMTLKTLEEGVCEKARLLGQEVTCLQSNFEGQLIEWIHDSECHYDAVIFNPGAFTHYSYAIRDAIESVNIPYVEVHLSDIKKREPFRAISVIAPVCLAQFYGEQENSYFRALEYLKTLP